MKVAAILFAVISLSALALAGPAFNKNQNQVEADKAKQQYMSSEEIKQTAAIESLKQWCFSSKMSQPELTASFKKLVSIVESQPEDKNTESAVMSERICQQSQKSTDGSQQVDPQAHELIKDVYMDSLIACESRKCMQQLIKIINSQQVDTIRASYYMTRIAVTETESIKKDDSQAKELADAFVRQPEQSQSEAIERQKLFALTSLIAKTIKAQKQPASTETKKMAQDVAKTIVERYMKTVTQDEVQQYKQQPAEQQSSQVARKIAKRSAALKALSNLPGPVICEVSEIEQTLKRIAEDKQELSTVRQSAIECLEQCESAMEELKKLAFDQEEQIEVRITAYRALISVAFNGQAEEQRKQQVAEQIIDQVVKHCEQQRNQQQDDQFVLYAISHLDNLRTSQQPEHKAIRECIAKNKQHYMQIQLLVKKFKQQLNQITKSSRNYKLEQEFNQLESGLIVEGDIVYESKNKQQKWGQQVLPKLMRVNMSMPVMGETVNVIEISLRQDNMDEELMGALKLVQTGKFNSETMSKVVDTFKTSVESSKRSDKKQTAEADLTIKVDGCTVVYVCIDDVKSIMSESDKSTRYTRSVSYSSNVVDQLIEQLRRKPVSFNRGFNFNLNQILAKVLRVEANLIAGLRFESRATGQSSKDFEIVVKAEPRFGFETIVGPAKMSSKKLLQRISTKTALGLRLRFKQDELVDVQLDLPLNTMELFTFETQMVEKNNQQDSYSYLPESIYGQQDIYQPREGFYPSKEQYYEEDYENDSVNFSGLRKRSVFDNNKKSTLSKVVSGKHSRFAQTVEVPEQVARATGLRGKLRFVAKPRDMSFLVSAFVEKYEPSMQGYRMQLEKVQRAQVEEQYVLTLSTPGSSVDRTMSVRLSMASTKLHTVVKTDIKSPFVGASAQLELIDDNRQYAVKALIASTRGKQWRHQFEAGVQRGSQSPAGRIATTYKPYLNVQSTALRRPVQVSGAFSFQQSPKTVINYELKCQTTGDYVQGKIMLDERQSSWASKRSMRSMQHSLELLLQKDVTLTSELVAQVSEHAFKVHKMLDWEPSKLLMVADLSASHKNLRKSYENELVANMKLSDKQQVLIVERKSPQQQHKQFRILIDSQFQTPTSHQLIYQARYSNKRVQNAQVTYKHQIELNQISARKFELIGQAELLAPEYQIDEKYQTRTQVDLERKLKSVHCQINSKDNKKVKFDMDFVSFGEHQIELQLQGERISHKCSVRADDRQFAVQSRTDKQGSMIAKMAVEVQKKLNEGQLIVEVPSKKVQLVADLKPSSGKVSSFALRTERFASKAEFSFETIARSMRNNKFFGSFLQQLKFKTDLKDMTNQEAYWMDSAWNSHKDQDSYLRFDSPVYRTDLEYSPREQMSKLGMYAREKRSTDTYKTLYSLQDSLLGQTLDKKIDLGNKMWMLRSSIPTAGKLDEIKQKARRAIFQYADRRQQQQHQIDYNPFEDRLSLDFDRQAYNNDNSMRFTGDIDTRFQTPSSFSLKSDWMNMDVEAKPFDGQELYGKIKANSRHPRSAFKEHDSQLSYNKQQGYKAYMKHTDKKNHKHQVEFEADKRPENWTKMSWNSDKHGKGHYEHNWQKHVKQGRQAEMYDNSLSLSHEAPRWSHNTQLSFEQPRMSQNKRFARDTYSTIYRPYDYLKQISARLNSQTSLDKQGQLYKLDFDFKPESHARFNLDMPAYELTHNSALEYEPTERTYKLQSRLFSKRQQQPEYEFVARTKPVRGLATAEQEPVFVTESHPIFEQPISNKLYANLFKQPLKVDYNDRFGRVASFDYDLLPVDSSSVLKSVIKNGLRQKRAAFYYKNAEADFEHDSKYDFYPESFLTKFKPEGKKSFDANVAIKSHTKYGPVVIRVDSNDKSQQVSVDTPVVDAKLTGISNGRDQAVYRLKLDNKQQQVQLAKIVRQTPVLRDSKLVQKIAQKIDNGRLEHETELVLSLLETIFKVHSQTKLNDRQVLLIDGELNHPEEKLVVKIDGERVDGQLLVDLIKQTADFDYLVDNGRTVSHQTRLVRSSNKYFTMDSMTTYKGRPWAKITGKVSAMVFSEPMHLFSTRYSSGSSADHESVFEAVVYQPKQKQVIVKYNCMNKEAEIQVYDVESQKKSEARIKYDHRNEKIQLDARTQSARGVSKHYHESIDVTPLIKAY